MATPSEFARELAQEIKAGIDLRKIFGRTQLNQIGEFTVGYIKDEIARGTSPIAGKGRFPAYKNPKNYPGKLKPSSPVNLKLTGQQLESLGFTVDVSKTTIRVRYTNRLARLKEQGHREGVKGQPKRPSIPTDGEQLNPRIVEKIRTLIAQIIRRR